MLMRAAKAGIMSGVMPWATLAITGFSRRRSRKALQLIFDILRLLPGEARHGVKPAKTLRGRTMTGRAIFEFRFNAAGRHADMLGSRLGLMTAVAAKKTARADVNATRKRTAFIFLASPPLPFFAARNLLASRDYFPDSTGFPLRALGRSPPEASEGIISWYVFPAPRIAVESEYSKAFPSLCA